MCVAGLPSEELSLIPHRQPQGETPKSSAFCNVPGIMHGDKSRECAASHPTVLRKSGTRVNEKLVSQLRVHPLFPDETEPNPHRSFSRPQLTPLGAKAGQGAPPGGGRRQTPNNSPHRNVKCAINQSRNIHGEPPVYTPLS